MFRREFAKRGNTLQFSSTAYWYQTEPREPLPPVAERAPAPEESFWPEWETLPDQGELRQRGAKLQMLCGRSRGELVFAEPGYSASATEGCSFEGWPLPVFHCRAGNDTARVELSVPKGKSGTVRIFVIDPDRFEGGRRQVVTVAGRVVAELDQFEEGRWLEARIEAADTAKVKVAVVAKNARQGANVVLSVIEWVESGR
jgi:hypothetical protein